VRLKIQYFRKLIIRVDGDIGERELLLRELRLEGDPKDAPPTSGGVSLRVLKLRNPALDTDIIERNRRRESSVEEVLVEMYLAGVSVLRVEDITEALWGTRVSPSTISKLNQDIYERFEQWRNRPLTGGHPYVFLDGVVLKRSWAGETRNVGVLAAIAVNAEGARDDKAGWSAFLKHLKDRGLGGVQLFTSEERLFLLQVWL
jgi:transposase-like protein